MEHIVQEGINTKKTQQSCPINLSGEGIDMVTDCSIVLFSTLWRQVFSRFLRQEEQIGYIKLN